MNFLHRLYIPCVHIGAQSVAMYTQQFAGFRYGISRSWTYVWLN
nr:MAG TPA: hypothetical protein [Caudoviricetes sp.]